MFRGGRDAVRPTTTPATTTDGGEKTCATAADKNPLEVSVAFADIDECETIINGFKGGCFPGRICENDDDNPGADPICTCGPGTTGDGITCNQDRTVELRPSPGGTVFAMTDDGSVLDGETVVHETTITFTARPDAGYYVSRWSLFGCATAGVHFGSPSDTGEKSCEVVAGLNLAANLPVLASVTFGDIRRMRHEQRRLRRGRDLPEPAGEFSLQQVRAGAGGRVVRRGFAEGGDDGFGGRDLACDSGGGLLCSGVDGFGMRGRDGEFGGDGFGGAEELCFVGDGGGDGGGLF